MTRPVMVRSAPIAWRDATVILIAVGSYGPVRWNCAFQSCAIPGKFGQPLPFISGTAANGAGVLPPRFGRHISGAARRAPSTIS